MITIHDLESSDVAGILADPWEVTTTEIGEDIDAALDVIIVAWDKSKYAVAFRANDLPVAILGAYHHADNNVWYSWFIASSLFNAHGREVTREIKRCMCKWMEKESPCRIVSITSSENMKRDKWYNLLGFDRKESMDYNYGGKHMRCFQMEG